MGYSTMLVLQIGAGAVGLLSVSAALVRLKSWQDRYTAWKLFLGSVTVMAACTAYIGYRWHEPLNLLGGAFVLYLLTTAWTTLNGAPDRSGVFRVAVFLVSVTTLAACLGYAPPGEWSYLLAAISGLSAAGDLRLVVFEQLERTERIIRYLWRTGCAIALAYGLPFIGTGGGSAGLPRFEFLLLALLFILLLLTTCGLVRTPCAPHPMRAAPEWSHAPVLIGQPETNTRVQHHE